MCRARVCVILAIAATPISTSAVRLGSPLHLSGGQRPLDPLTTLSGDLLSGALGLDGAADSAAAESAKSAESDAAAPQAPDESALRFLRRRGSLDAPDNADSSDPPGAEADAERQRSLELYAHEKMKEIWGMINDNTDLVHSNVTLSPVVGSDLCWLQCCGSDHLPQVTDHGTWGKVTCRPLNTTSTEPSFSFQYFCYGRWPCHHVCARTCWGWEGAGASETSSDPRPAGWRSRACRDDGVVPRV